MKVVTFGEIMMRLNPEGYKRFIGSNRFEVSYSGGEANVAVSLANFGIDTAFVTKVPQNDLGTCAIQAVRHYGVDTSFIVRGGDRLGVYFLEKGASQRPSKVIYDRARSSIAESSIEDFNWDEIFKDATWFHFTGITPALGGNNPEICLLACKKAKEKGLTVSCDLNFRKKLWTSELAGKVMSPLMEYVDVCIANEEDAADVFGIHASNTDINSGELNLDGYVDVAQQLIDRFSFKKVAITLRGSISASVNEWGAMIYDGEKAYFSPRYTIQIVDRVGGGDSFGAGLIYSLLNDYSMQESINYAVAASCLKHTIEYDFNIVSVDEVKALAAGNASGRVQR